MFERIRGEGLFVHGLIHMYMFFSPFCAVAESIQGENYADPNGQ